VIRSSKKFFLIYSRFREEILAGDYAVGCKLPNETEIAQQFHCSLGTVGKALALLMHEGLVDRRARVGTTVIAKTVNSQPPVTQLDALAFIYPSEQHEGIWRTVRGFQDAAREAGRRVVMLTTGIDYQKEAEFISRLSEFDVRGAVIYPIIPTPQEQVRFSQMLVNSKFPVVLVEVNLPGLGGHCVVIDGLHAGSTMTRHMIARGAKSIGYFSNYAWAPFMRDRYQGYRWAMEEAGIPEPQGGVYLASFMHPDFNDPLAEPTEMADAFLEKAPKLDAVVCADDFLALGCIAAAKKRGIKVPDDMLVSGIDDHTALALSSEVSLTTYHVPFEEMGRKAFSLLDLLVSERPSSTTEMQVRGNLISRDSA
jgi:DNA-binding LacI/PurR family transcriptional regulator